MRVTHFFRGEDYCFGLRLPAVELLLCLAVTACDHEKPVQARDFDTVRRKTGGTVGRGSTLNPNFSLPPTGHSGDWLHTSPQLWT